MAFNQTLSIAAPRISNIEGEAAFLGGLMIANQLIDKAADIVAAEDFAEPLLGRVYQAIQREHDLGHNANPVTLKPYFDADPSMAEVGGPGFLAQLTGSGAAAIGCLDFGRQLAELAARRRFAEQMGFLSRAAEDYGIGLDQLAADAEAAIGHALKAETGGASLAADKCIEQALDVMANDMPPGVTSGNLIPSLDHVLGPIRAGHLVIIAGRPGMGKTALALSYAHGVGAQGHGVLFASAEMRAEELGARLACDVAYGMGEPVLFDRMSDGQASPQERRSIARAALKVRDMPIWIEDLPSATIGRLAAIVRRQKRRFLARGQSLALVIVDYLQLIQPNQRERSRYEAVGAVSRGMKALAKAENVGVLALCQLSREVEKRSDKRPNLGDLRDSGDIEQDADTVCFLLRREEYLNREEPRPETLEHDSWRASLDRERGRIEFIVAKRRGGRTATGHGEWLGQYQAVRG